MGNSFSPEKKKVLISRFHNYDQLILTKAILKNEDSINSLLEKSKNYICCLATEYLTTTYTIHLMIYRNNQWKLESSYNCKY
jgi:hypothetical protein